VAITQWLDILSGAAIPINVGEYPRLSIAKLKNNAKTPLFSRVFAGCCYRVRSEAAR
jgi:hypothetical protein